MTRRTWPVGDAHKAVGLFLLAWAIFTLYMTIAAMRTSGAVLAVFVALAITFIFLTIGNFGTGNTAKDWSHIGGWFGFVTALLAWYASFAGVTNATLAKTVLPTWPLANRTRGHYSAVARTLTNAPMAQRGAEP